MKLAGSFIPTYLEFEENMLWSIVLENRRVFRDALQSLMGQCAGYDGSFVLSKDDKPVSFYKCAELITSPLSLEINDKRFISKIQKEALSCADNFQGKSFELISKLNSFAAEICFDLQYDVTYSPFTDLSRLIKALDFEIDTDSLTLDEQVIEFVKLCRNLLGKELFIFINLKAFYSKIELSFLMEKLLSEKVNVLLIDSYQADYVLSFEKRIIVDDDCCII